MARGGSVMAAPDCCREVEQLVDQIIVMIRENFNDEKEVDCYRTPKLPLLPDESVYFGRPTVLFDECAVSVLAASQGLDEGPTIRRDGTQDCCPWNTKTAVEIHWWFREFDWEEAHRNVGRMAEVIKRIIARNRYLIETPIAGETISHGKTSFGEIVLHDRVRMAFGSQDEAESFWMAHGFMELIVEYSEHYEGSVAPGS